jgi:hypothetical protein
MPFTPPSYAARYDWENKLENPPGNATQGWQVELAHYLRWRKTGDITTGFQRLSLEEAWARLKLSQDNAKNALSTGPVRNNNAVGSAPPEIASRVFARSVAKDIDPRDDYPDLRLKDDITSLTTEERSFVRPSYRARPDWRQRLESMDPDTDSWQADLVRYWTLRASGTKEEEAWAAVAMTPDNARLALSPPDPTNDSGLIPCVPTGQQKDTVARRVFARSMAKTIDSTDIYNDLDLEPSE